MGVDVTVMIDERDGYTPTPAISHAILTYNRNRHQRLADGVVITPSHNPPEDGGFKYNPPNGGPADTDITTGIERAANAFLEDGLRGLPADFVSPRAQGRLRSPLRLHWSLRGRPCQRHRHGGDPRLGRENRDRSPRAPASISGNRSSSDTALPRPSSAILWIRLSVHDSRLGRQDPDGLLVALWPWRD